MSTPHDARGWGPRHPLFAMPEASELPGELVTLFERIGAAIAAVNNAGSLEHRRGRVAAQHLEHEIAPFVEMLDLEAIIAKVRADAIEANDKKHGRGVLPISSPEGQPIARGVRATITTRPQGTAMKIEHIRCIEGFLIHDITIGNRSQFQQAGAIRSEDLNGQPIVLDVIQRAMDFTIEVEYVGDNVLGGVFRGGAIGILARYGVEPLSGLTGTFARDDDADGDPHP